VVNHLWDHKGWGLRLWFFRYSFAKIFLALRDWRGFSCGKASVPLKMDRAVSRLACQEVLRCLTAVRIAGSTPGTRVWPDLPTQKTSNPATVTSGIWSLTRGRAQAAMAKIAAAHPANYDPTARFDLRTTMPHHLQFEQWVPFPLEDVFAFFSNPENLPRIMPESSATKLIELKRKPAPSRPPGVASDKAPGVGSTIVMSFRVFPGLPRARWIARITEFEWNRYFADMQEKGPFKSWHHRHEFAAGTRDGVSGTLVRDVVDYEVGFGLVGVMANAVFVRRQMKAAFAQRQQVLPQLLA
jgi:ligand-binding SRPBCC domain-containing protein